MSYQYALEIAGAKVHAFERFGSYQGDWWAFATYKGKIGWVRGSYGSCSVCDAFEGEFGYDSHDCKGGKYYDPIFKGKFYKSCPKCQEIESKFIKFGEGYLDGIMSQKQAIKEASKDLKWDMEAQEVITFIKKEGSL